MTPRSRTVEGVCVCVYLRLRVSLVQQRGDKAFMSHIRELVKIKPHLTKYPFQTLHGYTLIPQPPPVLDSSIFLGVSGSSARNL